MDISQINRLPATVPQQPLLPRDLLQQLLQLGSIEARVLAIDKGQAVLNTRLGQILSANTLDLKAGDTINLRAAGSEQAPILKVSKRLPAPVSLSHAANQKLVHVLPVGQTLAALVMTEASGQTVLQLASQRIAIQAQEGLKPGQLVGLTRPETTADIEVRTIDHQIVLKSALSRLMPQQLAIQQPSALTQLAKLLQASNNHQVDTNGKSVPVAGNHAISKKPFPSTQPNTSTSQSSRPSISADQQLLASHIIPLLKPLLSALLTPSRLDSHALKTWLQYFIAPNLDRKPGETGNSNPYQLLRSLAQIEKSVYQSSVPSRAGLKPNRQAPQVAAEVQARFEEPLQFLSREVFKLAEQAIGQQLLQQTNLRYQQDLQQPFALNFSIPLDEHDRLSELKLKVRQQKANADPEQQAWDIHLDFEFGSLGMVSTHLMLQANTISASFWSHQPETQIKIDKNLGDFKQQLRHAGFELGQFYSLAGSPPPTDKTENSPVADNLLDIRV